MQSFPLMRRDLIVPLIVFAIYMLAAVSGALLSGNGEFIFYIVVMLVLAGVVLYVHSSINLTTPLVWCLVAWGAMHMAGGLVPLPESWPINGDQRILYSWWLIDDTLKYDQITHAFGFGTTCWLCWHALVRVTNGTIQPSFGVLSLCVFAATGLGALNEIIEFVATLMGPTNVGGYVNTALDLVANLVGAVIAAILIAWHHAGQSKI
jgi:uncharacterized membrane protein YjdF